MYEILIEVKIVNYYKVIDDLIRVKLKLVNQKCSILSLAHFSRLNEDISLNVVLRFFSTSN